MANFISNRQKTISIGISNYTEGSTVLDATGNVSISGIVTAQTGSAVTYYGDGSNLTGIAVTNLQFNNSSISIATTDGSILLKSNNVLVASISSETVYWRVPLHLNNNRIISLAPPAALSDAVNKDYVDNQVAGGFPTGDYGLVLIPQSDVFGQIVTDFVTFDCLTDPEGSLATTDLGVLT